MHHSRLAAWLLVVLASSLLPLHADEETCAACDRKVIVTGQFQHARGHESLTIVDAPRRKEEAFREEIQGTQFTLTIPHLPAGKYLALIGLAEVDYLKAGERAFDIACGDQLLATNLDIFATAGGAGHVIVLKRTIDFPGDALRGPLTFTFTGHTNVAKLNTFELREVEGQSLISFQAADLVDAEDASALKIPVVAAPEIWRDPAQPNAARAADLVQRLSLAEKIQQMRNGAAAIPRLHIPAYDFWNECLHGVARAGNATVFPQAIGMAAMWDESLMQTIGDTIATEGRAKFNTSPGAKGGDSKRYHGLTFWTPNINIYRDPRWGRGQETYGEDPFLTGRLGVSFIRGLQGNDPKYFKAIACAKHFAVHSGPEPARHSFDVAPTERDLYETYLPQFEMAVREGHVGAFMGAYNALYGVPACSSSFLLNDLLRRQWGFDGHVVSDCGAIYDIYANHHFVTTSEEASAAAVKAGTDLCCGTDYNSLTRAVKAGLLTPADIDTAVIRLFKARFDLGLFDPPAQVPYSKIPGAENDSPAHEALALKAAQESIVLLKNDGVLPLNRAKLKHILVVGTNATSVPMLLGNYNGTPSRPVTILEGIRQVVGTNTEVTYALGCPLATTPEESGLDALAQQAVAAAQNADAIIYVGGISPQIEGEEMKVNFDGFVGGDRTRIELPVCQTALLQQLQATHKPVIFVNCSGGAIAFPWEARHLPAIVQAWYPGEQGGRAVADVLFGNVNPSGRLPVTFYQATTDLPDFNNYSMSNRTYRYFSGQPLYAFGHGLSYTQFRYRQASKAIVNSSNDTVQVHFNLKNTGKREGEEVVQVYFCEKNSPQPQPRLALCGFQRVTLKAGAATPVSLSLPLSRFRFWDPARKSYVVEAGQYELLIGPASNQTELRVPFTLSPAAAAKATGESK
jgi:beta-glucosidase